MKFPERLKALRLEANLTQKDMADKFNISQMISDFRIININDTDKMSIEYMTNLYNKFIIKIFITLY